MSEHRPPSQRKHDEAYAIREEKRAPARDLVTRNLRDPRQLLEKLLIGELIMRRPGRR